MNNVLEFLSRTQPNVKLQYRTSSSLYWLIIVLVLLGCVARSFIVLSIRASISSSTVGCCCYVVVLLLPEAIWLRAPVEGLIDSVASCFGPRCAILIKGLDQRVEFGNRQVTSRCSDRCRTKDPIHQTIIGHQATNDKHQTHAKEFHTWL